MAHKVIWKEGSFILPQHFQQQERYLLDEFQNRIQSVEPYWWGFSQLAIIESDLAFGQFSLNKCICQFQDGTVFSAPEVNTLPSSIKIQDGVVDSIVYLVLPRKVSDRNEIKASETENSIGRLISQTVEVHDVSCTDIKISNIEVGKLTCSLMVETQEQRIPDGYMKLSVAKVKEVNGGRIVLCDQFISTLINTQASYKVSRFLKDLAGMINARGDSLAERATASGSSSGITEYSDFLLLQMINRLEPWLIQTITLEILHPFELYKMLVSVAGELATFMKKSRRPSKFPIYQHDKLNACLDFIFEDIQSSFTVVLDQVAVQIELSPPKNNIRAARLNHKALLESGVLVLAIAANIPEENLRNEFPAQTKIGPGEKIFQLMQSALPGITLNLLSHVPQEIPYLSGFCYFEMSKQDEIWQDLKKSKGLAIHVGGSFPGLEMKLWAINRK